MLADVQHRLRHIEGRPKDWRAFFAEAVSDPVLEQGVALAIEAAKDCEVVYLTGRPEHCRSDTLEWLQANGLPSGSLHMRPQGDRRPAVLLKPRLLRSIARGRQVAVVVDDDIAVCDAYEAAGWPVLRATWADRSATLERAQEGEGRT